MVEFSPFDKGHVPFEVNGAALKFPAFTVNRHLRTSGKPEGRLDRLMTTRLGGSSRWYCWRCAKEK